MPSRSRKGPSRQFTTLATLVASMTLGTFLLNWIHDLTPSAATTLRSVPAASPWDRILVQCVLPNGLTIDGRARGFHHLHVARNGTVVESAAWNQSQRDARRPRAIVVAVSVEPGSSDLTPTQWQQLSHLLRRLQDRYGIPSGRVELDPGSVGGLASGTRLPQLQQMLKTR
ncbi:MAG: N-acetylmuramoyl-L-alanine amidase [Phycisphaerae bacterium]|nr:N-acetylmuramoyl-L-alanine amidase [Phycisphaerae bacterium]